MTQSITSTQLIELLNKVGDLLETRQQIKQQEVARLINETAPHAHRIEKDKKENALKFNVFSALGVTRKEVIQSRFLAYLLDPNEHHCQDSIFLDAFLTRIGLPEIGTEEQIKRVQVTIEHPAGKSLGGKDRGRMDIVLFCQPDWLVVIENKVDANEGEEQLPRYAEWLQEQKGYSFNRLIFLTPTGYESVTGNAGEYQQLSYLGLAEAFELLQNKIKSKSVRIVLNQYITACKLIGGIDVNYQDPELSKLLKEPKNIRIALEIEQQALLIRSQTVKEFGEHIQKILQSKIEFAELGKTWKASFWIDQSPLNVDIRTLKHQAKSNYSMLAEHIFSIKNKGWSGWHRPQWVDFKNQSHSLLDTKDLTNKMINDGNKGAEGWWVGWKYLRNGKNNFVFTDVDDIVACLEDNSNEDHPLANTIAEELWWMFSTYRVEIEALDSFKQAASL